MNPYLELLAQAVVGVLTGVLTIVTHNKLTQWRLRGLESRMKHAEGDISHLQQRTAALAARISQ